MKLPVLTTFMLLGIAAPCFAGAANLVANGKFELSTRRPGVPDDWAAAGAATVQQRLSLDVGHAGGRSAKLQCTELAGDGPSTHAMIAQSGKVGVRKGQWYRIAFWAKGEADQGRRGRSRAERIRGRGATRACRTTFTPSPRWQRVRVLVSGQRRPAGRRQPAAVLVPQHRHALAGRRRAGRIRRRPAVVPANRHRRA